MRKIKMMTSAVLLSLSLAFSLTACGTKSEPAADTTAAEAEVTETEGEAETAEEAANDEEEKVKVGVSWNADEIDEDAQLYIDAVTKAGGESNLSSSDPKPRMTRKMLWQKSMLWL